jgi:excisionase family DNA binding protein
MENPFETIDQRLASLEAKIDKLLTRLDNPGADAPIWLSSKQLAQHLVVSVSAVTNMRINKIPYYKIGGKILFKKQEIDEFIEKTRHKSGGENLQDYLRNYR